MPPHSPPKPNESPFPSSPLSSGLIAPFMRPDMNSALDMSAVPELAAVRPSPVHAEIAPQNPHDSLHRLRFRFPHLPIMPPPSNVRTIVLDAGGVAKNLLIPAWAKVAMFRGNGDYFVCFQGAAKVPTNLIEDDTEALASQSIYKPEGMLHYVGGIRDCSVVAAFAQTIVTMAVWGNGE